jgi:hypothetical protein
MPTLGSSNIFSVVYPPYSGGNHIANMLSLSNIFLSRFWSKDYYKELELSYERAVKSVHPSKTQQFYDLFLVNSKNLTKKYITVGHLGHYGQLLKKHNVDFTDSSCIMVTKPVKNERATKRYKFVDEINKNKPINITSDIYDLPLKILDTELFNSDNSIILNSDLLFNDDGSYYVQELLLNSFSIHLPNSIHDLHKLWIKMIDKSLL